jgi:hypothetical protein
VCIAVADACVTAAVPSPKLKVYDEIGVESGSVEPEASAVTANGATPDAGLTVSAATGAWLAIAIAWLFGASALPATSHDRYLTVADDDNVNGAE